MVEGMPLHVLVMKDPTGLWVGICLELGFAAQSKDVDEIPAAMQRAYNARVEHARKLGLPAFAHNKPAPIDYWRKFQQEAVFWREIEFDRPEPVFLRKLAA